jgi:hypothetical protein
VSHKQTAILTAHAASSLAAVTALGASVPAMTERPMLDRQGVRVPATWPPMERSVMVDALLRHGLDWQAVGDVLTAHRMHPRRQDVTSPSVTSSVAQRQLESLSSTSSEEARLFYEIYRHMYRIDVLLAAKHAERTLSPAKRRRASTGQSMTPLNVPFLCEPPRREQSIAPSVCHYL